MIRYLITLDELKVLIGKDWLRKAKTRTTKFRNKGYFDEKSSIWSEIKPIYMKLQGESKCAFCERKLESEEYGKGEQDVEHFRPKKGVKTWKVPDELVPLAIPFGAITEIDKGYHLLSYHPFNYSASCKPCNSVLKGNYFPIAGTYELTSEDPVALLSEQAYIIYPIGDFDDDPEELIEFYGIFPYSKVDDGFKHQKALITINFFGLNDVNNRKNLFRERGLIILALYPLLKTVEGNVQGVLDKTTAQELIDLAISSKAPHSNCARSYVKLFKKSPANAEELFFKIKDLILSIS
jgi:hypothetical protein